MPLVVFAAVTAMPKSAPRLGSVTLSTWPAGTAKSTRLDTSVPTAPDGAPGSSFSAVSTGLLLASRVGAVFAGITTFWANSDVARLERSVLVAEITCPTAAAAFKTVLNVALPLPSVVTLTKPR